MNIIELARPLLDFMAQNQSLTVFLAAMGVVGFALYVVLRVAPRAGHKSGE
jgi:hypothetical protein